MHPPSGTVRSTKCHPTTQNAATAKASTLTRHSSWSRMDTNKDTPGSIGPSSKRTEIPHFAEISIRGANTSNPLLPGLPSHGMNIRSPSFGGQSLSASAEHSSKCLGSESLSRPVGKKDVAHVVIGGKVVQLQLTVCTLKDAVNKAERRSLVDEVAKEATALSHHVEVQVAGGTPLRVLSDEVGQKSPVAGQWCRRAAQRERRLAQSLDVPEEGRSRPAIVRPKGAALTDPVKAPRCSRTGLCPWPCRGPM